jgi:hypothetical protein
MAKHNGPNDAAFPVPPVYQGGEQAWPGVDGLTVREWYAGMALAAIAGQIAKADLTPPEIAEAAFNIANAMLTQAKK